jgi:hypothetical protein
MYLLAFIFVVAWNIYYYQQIFIEAWMRATLANQPIVVTFTTTPHRIAHLQPTIKTILEQNFKVPVYLSIPHVFKRDNLSYTIPKWLEAETQIKILRTNDYGPATKLLGLLEQIPLSADTIIITLDDDVYYPPNLILQLAYKAYKNPATAVGTIGANIDYDYYGHIAPGSELGLVTIDSADAQVAVLKGYGGVAYRRNFFDQEIFDFVATQNPCLKADDVIFGYMLTKRNIPKIVLKNKFCHQWQIRWQSEIGVDANALHQLIPHPADKHRECLAYLHELTPEIHF